MTDQPGAFATLRPLRPRRERLDRPPSVGNRWTSLTVSSDELEPPDSAVPPRLRMRLSRRGFLQAGAAGAAGATLLSGTGCDVPGEASTEQTNVLLLIIDSLRPDHIGAYGSPQVQTPNIDSLAARGLRFNRAFPEAMVTLPARRSIFTSRRIFPFRNFVPNQGARHQPRLGADQGPGSDHVHLRVQARGLLDGAGERQPLPRLHQGVRTVPRDLRSLGGDRRPVDERNPPEIGLPRDVDHWLPPVLRDKRYTTGMRAYLANNGARRGRGADLRRPRLQEGDRRAGRRRPAPALLHDGRLLRSARAVEPAEQVHRHVRGPRLQGTGDRRDPLRELELPHP